MTIYVDIIDGQRRITVDYPADQVPDEQSFLQALESLYPFLLSSVEAVA